LAQLGQSTQIVATGPDALLYQTSDHSVHRLSASSYIVLIPPRPTTPGMYSDYFGWQLSDGKAFAIRDAGPEFSYYLDTWSSAGTLSELATLGPHNPGDAFVVSLDAVHGPWALVRHPAPSAPTTAFAFFNAQTSQVINASVPTASGFSDPRADFASLPGGLA